MKTSELIKLLADAGCSKVRDGKNHEICYSPFTEKKFQVWRHTSKEIPAGTANKILKDAGLK